MIELQVTVEEKIDKMEIETWVNGFNQPFMYEDEVDLRIIVMTYNRAESLTKCLDSIQTLELDGDKGRVDIWIDRKDNSTPAHAETMKVAESFKWKSGETRVHVQQVNELFQYVV